MPALTHLSPASSVFLLKPLSSLWTFVRSWNVELGQKPLSASSLKFQGYSLVPCLPDVQRHLFNLLFFCSVVYLVSSLSCCPCVCTSPLWGLCTCSLCENGVGGAECSSPTDVHVTSLKLTLPHRGPPIPFPIRRVSNSMTVILRCLHIHLFIFYVLAPRHINISSIGLENLSPCL